MTLTVSLKLVSGKRKYNREKGVRAISWIHDRIYPFYGNSFKRKALHHIPYYFKDVDTFYDIVLSPSLEEDTIDMFCLDSTELHNAQQMLSSTNHKLSLALEIANIIPWKWNLKEHSILCDINRPIIMTAMPGEIKEEQLSVSDEQYLK